MRGASDKVGLAAKAGGCVHDVLCTSLASGKACGAVTILQTAACLLEHLPQGAIISR